MQVSYLIVDEMHHEHPELIKDQYWDEVFPNELPYTIATERFREEHPEPSTAKIEVSKSAAMPTVMSSVRIDDMVGNSIETKPNTPNVQAVSYKFPDNIEEEVRIKYGQIKLAAILSVLLVFCLEIKFNQFPNTPEPHCIPTG